MVQVGHLSGYFPPTYLQKGATYCALAVSVCCDELSVTYAYLLLYTRLFFACDIRAETTSVQYSHVPILQAIYVANMCCVEGNLTS